MVSQSTENIPSRATSKPLITEVPVDAAGHHCVARPASFECRTPCPELAHEPRVLRKEGWDLFEDGVWVSGGLQVDATTGTMRPRFATPQAARDWLIEQQQQAHGVLRACGPGRASTSD